MTQAGAGRGAVAVGIDAAEVGRVSAAIERWGDRFLDRVFTPAERAYCDSRRSRDAHYAARFAVKEAVSKALGTGLSFGVRWRDVEIVRDPAGPPRVRLAGDAAVHAKRLGVVEILVSITHTRDLALAAAVAVGASPVENPDTSP